MLDLSIASQALFTESQYFTIPLPTLAVIIGSPLHAGANSNLYQPAPPQMLICPPCASEFARVSDAFTCDQNPNYPRKISGGQAAASEGLHQAGLKCGIGFCVYLNFTPTRICTEQRPSSPAPLETSLGLRRAETSDQIPPRLACGRLAPRPTGIIPGWAFLGLQSGMHRRTRTLSWYV